MENAAVGNGGFNFQIVKILFWQQAKDFEIRYDLTVRKELKNVLHLYHGNFFKQFFLF